MAGYVRQALANIANGLTIFAADLNAEFNQLVAAFNGTSGHTHDGSTGSGPKVLLTTSVTGVLPVANGGTGGVNKTDATTAPTINEDSNDGYAVGSVWIDVTNDVYYVCLDATVGAAVWRRFQPYDVDLTALGGVTSAADKVPYFTGAGTADVTTLSSYARTLIDDADAATARATLGATIGTNVQAYSANLQAISGLTSAADKGIQFTGSGTAATYDLTTYAKTILDDADASTALSTLGFSAYGKTLIDDADASAALSTLGVSAFAKTILDDADAATARTTLGVDASGTNQPLDATLTALAAYNTNGIIVQTAADTFAGRTLTGTANELTVTNGNGVSGNPTVSIPSAVTFTGKTITGGTFNSGTFSSGTFSGQFNAGAGSFGTPSISFSGDPNTGFYSFAADEIGYAVNGAFVGNFTATGFNIGKSAANSATVGSSIRADGQGVMTTNAGTTLILNRMNATGTIVDFRKDNVSVGTMSSTGDLSVGGDVTANSDISLKKDIETLDISKSIDALLQIDPVSFTRKANGTRGIGFIAQDVEKYYPELVHTNEEGIKSLAYANMVAILWRAVQDLQAKVAELEAK